MPELPPATRQDRQRAADVIRDDMIETAPCISTFLVAYQWITLIFLLTRQTKWCIFPNREEASGEILFTAYIVLTDAILLTSALILQICISN